MTIDANTRSKRAFQRSRKKALAAIFAPALLLASSVGFAGEGSPKSTGSGPGKKTVIGYSQAGKAHGYILVSINDDTWCVFTLNGSTSEISMVSKSGKNTLETTVVNKDKWVLGGSRSKLMCEKIERALATKQHFRVLLSPNSVPMPYLFQVSAGSGIFEYGQKAGLDHFYKAVVVY